MNTIEQQVFEYGIKFFQLQEEFNNKEYSYEQMREGLLEKHKEDESISNLVKQESSLEEILKKHKEKKKEITEAIFEYVSGNTLYKTEEEEFDKKLNELQIQIGEFDEEFSKAYNELIESINNLYGKDEQIKDIKKKIASNNKKIVKLEEENKKHEEGIESLVKDKLKKEYKKYEEKGKEYEEAKEHFDKLEDLKSESLNETYKNLTNELEEDGEYKRKVGKLAQLKEQIKETNEQIGDTYEMIDTELFKKSEIFEKISEEYESLDERVSLMKPETKEKLNGFVKTLGINGNVGIGNQKVSIKYIEE